MVFFSILAKFKDDSPILKLSTVIWCLYIGAVLGWAGVVYNKLIPGHAVRKILKKGLFSPDSAETPKELGLGGIYLFLLRPDSTLRRIVKAANEPEEDPSLSQKKGKKRVKSPKIKVSETKFYIPEELKYRAEIRYEYKKTDPVTLVIGAVLLLAVAVVLYNYVIPFVYELFTE